MFSFVRRLLYIYSFFPYYRIIPYYKPGSFLVSLRNNILYSVKFILISRLINDDVDDNGDNDDDIPKQRKI